MVMWQDLNGGRCSMVDACSPPKTAEDVYKMLIKNFERHYSSNRWVENLQHVHYLTAEFNLVQSHFAAKEPFFFRCIKLCRM